MTNTWIGVGRLTRDPEIRYAESGKAVAPMRIAVPRAGEGDSTDFFDVVAFGQLAEACATHLAKGRQILIEGSLRQQSWTDNDSGDRRSYTGLSRGKQRNDIYLVVDDDRDRDVELEEHGRHDDDLPSERFVRALGRDGAKVTATELRQPQHRSEQLRPLAELWAQRDAHDRASEADDLHLRRLDAAITRRTELAGRAAEIDRPAHIVAVLGEPATGLSDRERWRDAAGAIEAYRARWDAEPHADLTVELAGAQREHLADVSELIARAVVPDTPVDGVSDIDFG